MNRTKFIFLFLGFTVATALFVFEWGWGFSHELDDSSVVTKARRSPGGYTFDFHSEVPIEVQIYTSGGAVLESASAPYLGWHRARVEVKTGATYIHAGDPLSFRKSHRKLIIGAEHELVGSWHVRTSVKKEFP